jgi:hypothetical protein
MHLIRKKGKVKNFRTGCGKTIAEKALICPKRKLETPFTFVCWYSVEVHCDIGVSKGLCFGLEKGGRACLRNVVWVYADTTPCL